MTRPSLSWAAGLCVLLAATPTPASAAPPERGTGVLPVRVKGDAVKDRAEALGERVVEGLSRGEVSVSTIGDAACRDTDCAAAAARDAGVDMGIRTTVEAKQGDFDIHIEVVDTAGTVVAETRDTCEICGTSELDALVADLAAALLPSISGLQLGAAQMVIDGEPSGATVSIDGIEVGRTPYAGDIEPGEHSVVITKAGFIAQERVIQASEGVKENIQFTLNRDRRAAGGLIKPIGWAAVGVGVVATATGAALVAIDGNAHKGSCPEDRKDAEGRCPFQLNTLPGGAATLAIGLASLGTGVGLLVWSRKKSGGGKKDRKKKSAQVQVAPGWASLSVHGRF